MNIIVRHELGEDIAPLVAFLDHTLDNKLDKVDKMVNKATEKVIRIWALSLIGTGVVVFVAGVVVGKSL